MQVLWFPSTSSTIGIRCFFNESFVASLLCCLEGWEATTACDSIASMSWPGAAFPDMVALKAVTRGFCSGLAAKRFETDGENMICFAKLSEGPRRKELEQIRRRHHFAEHASIFEQWQS
jgi:hypothetical protein